MDKAEVLELKSEIEKLEAELALCKNKLDNLCRETRTENISENSDEKPDMQSQEYVPPPGRKTFQEPASDAYAGIYRKSKTGKAGSFKKPVYGFYQKNPQQEYKKSVKKKKISEEAVGRAVAGTASGILIFLSLIVFSTAVIPLLPDAIKSILMYLASAGVLLFGIFLINKEKENRFYRIIAGIGLGAVYLSIIIGNVYFHLYTGYGAYVILFLWSALAAIVSGYAGSMNENLDEFCIVGNIGIFLSVLAGCVLCIQGSDLTGMSLMAVYTAGSCLMVNSCQIVCTHRCSVSIHSFSMLNAYTLIVAAEFFERADNGYLFYIICAAVAVIGIFGYKTISWLDEKRKIMFQQAMILNVFVLAVCICYTAIQPAETVNLLFLFLLYAVCIVFSIESERNFQKKGFYASYCCIIFAYLIFMSSTAWIEGILVPLLFIVPVMIYSEIMEKKGMIILGSVLVFAWAAVRAYKSPWGMAGTILIAAAYYAIGKKKNGAIHPAWVIPILICFQKSFTGVFADIFHRMAGESPFPVFSASHCAGFCAAALLLLLAAKKWKVFHGHTKYAYAASAMFMTGGITAITYKNVPLWNMQKPVLAWCLYAALWCMTAALCTAVFFLNSRQLLSSAHRKRLAEIYVACKYSILAAAVISSFRTWEFVLSTCMILFSAACIYAGFQKDRKGFRLYGLILFVFFVCKISVTDIHMANRAYQAAAQLVSGIICLMVSRKYNQMEEKQKKEKQNV